jgi:hypothetical protein
MKGKLILLGLVMTGALAFFCAGWAGQKSPEKPAVKPQKPLIRKDLLQKKAVRMPAARRDLFSPRMTAGTEGLPLVMPKLKTTLPPEEAPSGESQAPPLTLHYIGYSYNETKQKFVALVFFEEQVTAVQEGDILPMGWKVLKITAKELEVEGPDKKSRTFSREGEQR